MSTEDLKHVQTRVHLADLAELRSLAGDLNLQTTGSATALRKRIVQACRQLEAYREAMKKKETTP